MPGKSISLLKKTDLIIFYFFRAAISPDELKKMENPPKFPRKKFPWNDNLRFAFEF